MVHHASSGSSVKTHVGIEMISFMSIQYEMKMIHYISMNRAPLPLVPAQGPIHTLYSQVRSQLYSQVTLKTEILKSLLCSLVLLYNQLILYQIDFQK